MKQKSAQNLCCSGSLELLHYSNMNPPHTRSKFKKVLGNRWQISNGWLERWKAIIRFSFYASLFTLWRNQKKPVSAFSTRLLIFVNSSVAEHWIYMCFELICPIFLSSYFKLKARFNAIHFTTHLFIAGERKKKPSSPGCFVRVDKMKLHGKWCESFDFIILWVNRREFFFIPSKGFITMICSARNIIINTLIIFPHLCRIQAWDKRGG